MAHIKELTDRLAQMPESRPASTEFEALDRMGVRFAPGKLYVIGGRPGMGKSSLMLDLALHAAREENTPVHIFTLTESATHLAKCMLTKYCRNPLYQLEEKVSACKAAAKEYGKNLASLPIHLYDEAHTICDIADTIVRKRLSGLVFIDDLQELAFPTGVYIGETAIFSNHPEMLRQRDVGMAILAVAQNTNTAIVVLSQINRSIEQRKNKRPRIRDVKNYPYMDATASSVLFLYQEAYYNPEAQEPAEIIVAKSDSGNTGTAYVSFDNEALSFK